RHHCGNDRCRGGAKSGRRGRARNEDQTGRVDAGYGPGGLPADASTLRQVPEIRHTGRVRQRGTLHVPTQQEVLIGSDHAAPKGGHPAHPSAHFPEADMQRRVLAAFAAAAALATAVPGGLQAQGRPCGENYFPNLSVVTHEGKPVRFYDDLIKGKMVIVSFIYTSCPDICPLSTARMAQVEDKLGDRVGRDIFIISMTVDPENDTPDRLKE